MLDPKRTIAELKELRSLTGDANGAQRVAFTPMWAATRAWLRKKLDALPVEQHIDAAGNLWATLRGESPRELLIGGHMDSVPNGGWLDGCLNVLAGLEILRRINAQYHGLPPVTVRLVDWADEEGARFGKSLFGSSACSGNLDLEEARDLKDKDGILLSYALKNVGIDLARVLDCGTEFTNAAAYLELHIEQGPVLLDLDLPLGAVLGTFGVERHTITFRGQAAHSGSTPMNRRKDAFLAAAKMSPEIYRITDRHGGVCTIGSCTTKPGIVTSVVEECRITLDQRHLDGPALARMLAEAKAASEQFAREGNVTVRWERLWRIAPVLFDEDLVTMCDESIVETCGKSHRLPSGPLHDAAEVARAGIPTVMMFVQSLHGISHNKIEDTREDHLEYCVQAFDRLAEKTLRWIRDSRRRTMGDLNRLSREEFTHLIGPIFEHSPWIAEAAWDERPFANVEKVLGAMCGALVDAGEDKQIALITAHPDLVGRAAREGMLTRESANEQATAGLNKLSPEEIALFEKYNAEYREKFGFPFVICARRNKKDAILDGFKTRLQNARGIEIKTALLEIIMIAKLRLLDILKG